MCLRITILSMLLAFATEGYCAGEKALTRGCKRVAMRGTYLRAGSGERKSGVAIDCAWGPGCNGKEANEVVLSSAMAEGASFTIVPPIEFFRNDKNVTREGNFDTGMGVMLGDRNRNYIRFCSYFIDEDRSAPYLEIGRIIDCEGKQKMERDGVLIVEKVDFYNIDGGKSRLVVGDYNPQSDYYLNALWSFFERMYRSFVRN